METIENLSLWQNPSGFFLTKTSKTVRAMFSIYLTLKAKTNRPSSGRCEEGRGGRYLIFLYCPHLMVTVIEG